MMVCLLLLMFLLMALILVVDDQPYIRELLSELLRKVSTVITSHSLEDALCALSFFKFDLVISDPRLDRTDRRHGLEILSHVRKVSPETRVMIMSGSGSTEAVKKEAYGLGAECFLEKPLNISDLYLKVQSLHN